MYTAFATNLFFGRYRAREKSRTHHTHEWKMETYDVSPVLGVTKYFPITDANALLILFSTHLITLSEEEEEEEEEEKKRNTHSQ
jgi:hypothetical protein